MKKFTKFSLALVVAVIVALIGFQLFKDSNNSNSFPALPDIDSDSATKNESNKSMNQEKPQTEDTSNEVMVTDGTRHTVSLDEIVSGGPPKDGIPSIDNPKFISVEEASEWLSNEEPGIAVSIDGVNRFYPYQILVWHEIVNDTINGEKVLVTYCPLCLTGFVFDPLVKGERVEFGTSGKLWKANLVMYDRKTGSLWSQVLGESIAGEMAGTELEKIPSDQIRFGEWKENFPDGEVLSKETGRLRAYGSNPYGSYFSVTDIALQMANPKDDRLPNDAFIFGIEVDGQAKAYSINAVKEAGRVEDEFQGKTFVLEHDEGSDVVKMYEENDSGELERIAPVSSFWFSWAAAYPNTELFK